MNKFFLFNNKFEKSFLLLTNRRLIFVNMIYNIENIYIYNIDSSISFK